VMANTSPLLQHSSQLLLGITQAKFIFIIAY
jgi:hypothetical protein